MPKPVYILCAESTAEDARTGIMSAFNIIERIIIEKLTPPSGGGIMVVPALPFRVLAAWMRNPDESPEHEYEAETAFYFPNSQEPLIVPQPKFYFGADRPLHRSMVIGLGRQLTPGMLRVESRIRKVGAEQWHSQDYILPIEEMSAIDPEREIPKENAKSA